MSGIKGQRKGIRRYQYANKTYTPAGNLRYRPPKKFKSNAKAMSGIATATIGATWLHMVGTTTGAGAILNTTLANVSSNLIALGSEIAAGFAAIPVPVLALTVPFAAMLLPDMIYRGKNFIEERTTLSHHGIKGMRWGVHNGPPYPLDRKVSANIKRDETFEGGLFKIDKKLSKVTPFSLEENRQKYLKALNNPLYLKTN